MKNLIAADREREEWNARRDGSRRYYSRLCTVKRTTFARNILAFSLQTKYTPDILRFCYTFNNPSISESIKTVAAAGRRLLIGPFNI